MKKLIITEEERSRILGMHQSAISKQYLKEDDTPKLPEWNEYYKAIQSIKIPEGGAYVSASYRVTPEEAKGGEVRLPFKYTTKLVGGTTQEASGQYYYVCANTPTDPTLKVGTTIDGDDKPKPDILESLNLGKTPFIKLFQAGCQAVYNIQKQNAQVAAAARLKKEAPNNPKLQGLIDAGTITQEGNRYFAKCTPGQNLYLFNKDGKTKFPVMTCNIQTGKDRDITNNLIEQGYILPN